MNISWPTVFAVIVSGLEVEAAPAQDVFEPLHKRMCDIQAQENWRLSYRVDSKWDGESRSAFAWEWIEVEHLRKNELRRLRGVTPQLRNSSEQGLFSMEVCYDGEMVSVVTEFWRPGKEDNKSRSIALHEELPIQYSPYLFYEFAVGVGEFDIDEADPGFDGKVSVYTKLKHGIRDAIEEHREAYRLESEPVLIDGISCLRFERELEEVLYLNATSPELVVRRVLFWPGEGCKRVEYTFDDYREVAGIMMPFKITQVSYCNPYVDSERRDMVSFVNTIVVDELEFGEIGNEEFFGELPRGSRVTDMRTGRRYLLHKTPGTLEETISRALEEYPARNDKRKANLWSWLPSAVTAFIVCFVVGVASRVLMFARTRKLGKDVHSSGIAQEGLDKR